MTPEQRAVAQIEGQKLYHKMVEMMVGFVPCAELPVRAITDIARFAKSYAIEAIEAVIDGETK